MFCQVTRAMINRKLLETLCTVNQVTMISSNHHQKQRQLLTLYALLTSSPFSVAPNEASEARDPPCCCLRNARSVSTHCANATPKVLPLPVDSVDKMKQVSVSFDKILLKTDKRQKIHNESTGSITKKLLGNDDKTPKYIAPFN